MTIFEIQMDGTFFYAKARTEAEAAAKVKAAHGGRWSHAFATGRTKEK